MDKTSTVSDLSLKLQRKTQQDSEQSRALILVEQEKLLNDLSNTYRDGLNTTLSGIQETLQSRLGKMAMLTASEAQTVERMVEQHQERLTKVLSNHYAKVRKAIQSQAEPVAESLNKLTESMGQLRKEAERTAKRSRRRWLFGWTVGLSVLVIICTSIWGLMQYLSTRVQGQLETISEQTKVIDSLREQTHGLLLVEAPSGTFLLLPPNAQTGYEVGGQYAIKLPNH